MCARRGVADTPEARSPVLPEGDYVLAHDIRGQPSPVNRAG